MRLLALIAAAAALASCGPNPACTLWDQQVWNCQHDPTIIEDPAVPAEESV